MNNSFPILFSAPMVRAILAGAKSVTRRIVNSDRQPRVVGQTLYVKETFRVVKGPAGEFVNYRADNALIQLPDGITHCSIYRRLAPSDSVDFKGRGRVQVWPWRPSIFLPKKLARIALEITQVSRQRLQEITADDAIAEGIERITHIGPCRCMGWRDYIGGLGFSTSEPVESFRTLWDSINADTGLHWADNPLVHVIHFSCIPYHLAGPALSDQRESNGLNPVARDLVVENQTRSSRPGLSDQRESKTGAISNG